MRGRNSESATGRARIGPAPDPAAPLYAAIDLGTHNCRLLIARAGGGGRIAGVGAFSRPVRLGEGVVRNGRLSGPAMGRALDALALCSSRIAEAGVQRTRAVATEACRRAANGAAFLRRVRRATGLEIELISPLEEARLTLAACTELLDPRFPFVLLFDIGGGSTEVVWAAQRPGALPQLRASLSLSSGVVSFAERFGGDRIDAAGFAAMTGSIDAGLRPFDAAHNIAAAIAAGQVQMIGTSGTVTTLAALSLGLGRYRRARVDGLAIRFAEINALIARLSVTDWAARAANLCIGPDRADLVVAGCAILDAICRLWPVGRISVADRGLREGLILSMHAATTIEQANLGEAEHARRARSAGACVTAGE
jgi:Exopolyphosphatase